MTSQEAAFWVSTGLLVMCIIVAAIGASVQDNGRKGTSQGEEIAMMLAGALGCMAGLGYLKWIAGFFFN